MVVVSIVSNSKLIRSSIKNLDMLSVEHLINDIARESNLNPNRIRLTLKRGPSGDSMPMDFLEPDFCLMSQDREEIEVHVEDKGFQINAKAGYLSVYLLTLLCACVIYWFCYVELPLVPNRTQKLAFSMVLLHFSKRMFEVLFVHKYSSPTMSFSRCLVTLLLSETLILGFLFTEASVPNPSITQRFFFHVNNFPPITIFVLFSFWAFAELSNSTTHTMLAGLRTKSTQGYYLPHGFGFDLVTCPNYSFEWLAWFFFTILVGNMFAIVHLICISFTMYAWAIEQQVRYTTLFGKEYTSLGRPLLIPRWSDIAQQISFRGHFNQIGCINNEICMEIRADDYPC